MIKSKATIQVRKLTLYQIKSERKSTLTNEIHYEKNKRKCNVHVQ